MAVETNGGTWVNVAGNDEKAHVNIYNNNPRETHDSIHINIDYDDESFSITEKMMVKQIHLQTANVT